MSEKTYSDVYMILSLRWSEGLKKLNWWAPDNSGYCYDIDKAGRYTAEQVAANPGYYDNDVTTRAVPLYNVMEGILGPIQRIVAASYIPPREYYDCHACEEQIVTDPRFSKPSICLRCKAYTCDICHDIGRCSEVESEVNSGRSAIEESGA